VNHRGPLFITVDIIRLFYLDTVNHLDSDFLVHDMPVEMLTLQADFYYLTSQTNETKIDSGLSQELLFLSH